MQTNLSRFAARFAQARHTRLLKPLVGSLLASMALSGCTVIYKTTGDVMKGFAMSHTVPYVMETDDAAINCAMSEALSPLLMSFGRVTAPPDQLAVMMNLSAGSCEEQRAWESELAYMQALREQRPEAAQDALIAQKRHYVTAAKRFHDGWKHFVLAYGEPGTGECPDVDDEMDGFIYMAGLMTGLQALNSEIQSTAPVGVPKNIASIVERSASCLDDNTWWGVPVAMKATVWALLPGAEPKGENAFARLKTADAKGNAAGVRLAHVMHLLAAWNKGDMDQVREVIREHAAEIAKTPANPQWKMIDRIATLNVTAVSDRMWVENTGHRTPIGGLGTFWDDKKEPVGEVIDLDSIL